MKWFFCVFLSFSFIFLSIFGINCVYGHFFPMRYQEEIVAASQKSGLDEAVIYSVINIESHFNKNALSPKGAVGLMQIMPSTAEGVAGNEVENLYDPETNIILGSLYLAEQLKMFKDITVALCAYNAGPANVRSWLANSKYSDDGQTLKEIPFSETRNYIIRFNRNFRYYTIKLK